MVEVVVVGTKEKEEEKYWMSTMNTNTVSGDAAADDHGGEEEKVTIVVIEAVDGTNVKAAAAAAAAAAAGDQYPTVVDGKKLKAWVIQLIMWSCVYFLLYWILLVTMIKRDHDSYGVTMILHGIIPFSLLFFAAFVTAAICARNKINSLVLLVNNNISPSPGTFESSTTTIDQMKKEIRDSSVCVLCCSFGYILLHVITMVISKIIMAFIGKIEVGATSKADVEWHAQVMFVGCIFFVTVVLHILWYDHTISKELGLEAALSISHTHSIDQPAKPHTDNTTKGTNVM